MKRFFSRFNKEYDRSLLYMLQASEYNLEDYFAWYWRVVDFRHVQKRKKLVWTVKVKGLYAAELLLTLSAVLLGIRFFALYGVWTWVVLVLLIGSAVTFVLPYWLALFVLVGQVVQWPVEQMMIARAKSKLARHKAFKIAIAGSYGKTSMREILRTVLSEGKRVAAPGGSENTPIGIARFVSRLKGDEEILIFELGEYYPGDIKQLCEMVRPDLGVITGVNEAHLSRFKTLKKVSDTVFELADSLHNKPLYVNGENAAALARASAAFRFSREGVADWHIVAPETSLDGTSFILEQNNVHINAQSKLLGLHQIGPLAAAAHIGMSLGLTVAQIEAGIAKTKPFAHRLKPREDGGIITLDDSYNGNPDGVKAVIEFLASIESRRRWYVTPGLVEMGSMSEVIHKNIGKQLAEANIEKAVLIKNSVTPWIEQGLKEASYGGDTLWFDDALKCYEQLPYMTVSGDVVVLQNDWPDQYQ